MAQTVTAIDLQYSRPRPIDYDVWRSNDRAILQAPQIMREVNHPVAVNAREISINETLGSDDRIFSRNAEAFERGLYARGEIPISHDGGHLASSRDELDRSA